MPKNKTKLNPQCSCAHLWRIEVECALNAGRHARQYDAGVALEALCAAIHHGHEARLVQLPILVLQHAYLEHTCPSHVTDIHVYLKQTSIAFTLHSGKNLWKSQTCGPRPCGWHFELLDCSCAASDWHQWKGNVQTSGATRHGDNKGKVGTAVRATVQNVTPSNCSSTIHNARVQDLLYYYKNYVTFTFKY